MTDFKLAAGKDIATHDAELNASQKTCNIAGPSLATAHTHVGRLEPGGLRSIKNYRHFTYESEEERNGEIKPVEVKSGASGRMRSLHQILLEYPNLKTGYVLSSNEYAEMKDQKLVYVPIYYAGII